MRSTGSDHYIQIDFLRTFAISIVVLNHALTSRNFPLGGFGICLLFVLSGYFATRSLFSVQWKCSSGELKRSTAAVRFTKRRWIRLLPIYYVILAVAFAFGIPDSAKYLIWNLCLGTNIAMLTSGEWAGFYSPFWSLAALEQILIFWPWLILFVPRTLLQKTLLFFVTASLLYRMACAYYQASDFWWFMNPLACIDSIAIGGLLAIHRAEKRTLSNKVGLISGLLFLLLIVAKAFRIQLPFAPVYSAPIAAIFFAWVTNLAHEPFPGWAGKVFSWRIFEKAGKASYSTFLVHGFFILGFPLPADASPMRAALQATGLLFGSFFVGWLVYHLIERPLGTILRRPELVPVPKAV